MLLDFLQTGKALSVLAVIAFIGVASKLVTRNLYKRLLKETENMAMTRNKNLKILKQKLENTYRLNQNIVNTQAYLDKLLYGFRFMHLSLDTWNNLSVQMMLLGFLVGGAGSFLSYWYRLDSYYIVLYASAGALSGLLLAFLDSSFNINQKQQKLETILLEYVDNSVFVRAARENPGREAAASRSSQFSGSREQSAFAANRGQSPMDRSPSLLDRGQSMADREQSLADREQLVRENEIKDGLVREEGPRRSAVRALKNRNSRAEDLLRTVRNMKEEETEPEAAGRNGAEKHGTERGGAGKGIFGRNRDPEPLSPARRDIEYLKQSLEQIAASREDGREELPRGADSPGNRDWTKNLNAEEMKLIGEIVRQYFSGN